MPALNYDYDYYEYRNGRRVGSSVPQRKVVTTQNRTNTVRKNTVATRANSTKKNVTQTRPVSTKKKVAVKKNNTKKVNVKKSKIDIPLESSKKVSKKPEAVKLTSTKTKVNPTTELKKVALVSVFFCMFFMVCYRYSIINEQFSNLKKIKTELATIQTANEQIQADIEGKTDLTYVENYAKYQLGMQKPTNSQIQYVHVDKQDKITTPVTINETEEMNWFEKMVSEIRKFID